MPLGVTRRTLRNQLNIEHTKIYNKKKQLNTARGEEDSVRTVSQGIKNTNTIDRESESRTK